MGAFFKIDRATIGIQDLQTNWGELSLKSGWLDTTHYSVPFGMVVQTLNKSVFSVYLISEPNLGRNLIISLLFQQSMSVDTTCLAMLDKANTIKHVLLDRYQGSRSGL